ncbi:MAG TPA: SDR family NAD(P)-dependent oxidoreductase [Acidimicrobiales bacterium]|nr:SDR family NAD(P)-dependent oxidoreductase [Acidimicrobiales bacterium]
MKEFSGRVAVITGGASGIGLAMARRFASEGMRLVLADIEEPGLTKAVEEFRSAGTEAVGVVTDVADHDSVVNLHDRTLEAFGSVHIVCNNAGVVGRSIVDSSIDMWRWVVGVNLFGVINGCNVFLPTLVEQGEGHVVNTASVAGLRGNAILGIYCTTKFAVIGLSESLFEELRASGSRVGVSVVCPGFVQTRIADSHRNMPAPLKAAQPGPSDQVVVGQAVAAGIPASEVAEAVFDAVVADRLYVLTHVDMARSALDQRLSLLFEQGS